ncbi:MAG TPA: hypothetical protein DGG95_02115 [Cytophagales bacterium]|nr:hypothetical protein [Cytophagales bacterium]
MEKTLIEKTRLQELVTVLKNTFRHTNLLLGLIGSVVIFFFIQLPFDSAASTKNETAFSKYAPSPTVNLQASSFEDDDDQGNHPLQPLAELAFQFQNPPLLSTAKSKMFVRVSLGVKPILLISCWRI